MVLVEASSGELLWDARIGAISRRAVPDGPASFMIDAYRVHYNGWSGRYVEWVKPSRVVEPNENNRLLQEELLEETLVSQFGIPAPLNMMFAKDYLFAKDRARGNSGLPDFRKIALSRPSDSLNDRTFALMKAALLAIEAALPIGSINTNPHGLWSDKISSRWKDMVLEATGAAHLMRLVILLEDAITEEWMKEDVGHLRACLPSRWKAIGEACPSGLAVRIILLDRAILYGTVDRKRFSSKKRKA